MTLSHDLLIESKSVRSQALNGASDEQALKVLNKARSILLATWKGVGYATTEQVAAFYEVALTTIKETYRIDKQEFDGEVIMLAGQDLRDARQVICLPSKTSQALVWTAKAFLRVGLMLRDSEIAKKLRDIVVDTASKGDVQAIDAPRSLSSIDCFIAIADGIKEAYQNISSDIWDAQNGLKIQASSNFQQLNARISQEMHSVSEDIKELKELIQTEKAPTPFGDHDKYRVNIRFKQHQYEQVMALADASGMPRATFLREVLLAALGVQDA